MFKADDIAALDYDFSTFYEGGPKGIVPEPSTGAIGAYQLALSNLMEGAEERVKNVLVSSTVDKTKTTMDETDPGLDEDETSLDVEQAKNAEIDKINRETWDERKRLLAELCQHSPPLEDINRLGHRVFLKFEEYVLGKWTPQAVSAATS